MALAPHMLIYNGNINSIVAVQIYTEKTRANSVPERTKTSAFVHVAPPRELVKKYDPVPEGAKTLVFKHARCAMQPRTRTEI